VSCFLQEYLARLEAIRRQNFQERKELQRRMAGVRAPVEAAPAQVLKDSSLFFDTFEMKQSKGARVLSFIPFLCSNSKKSKGEYQITNTSSLTHVGALSL